MLSAKTLTAHRDVLARAWALAKGIVLIPSGLPVPVPGSDQPFAYVSHPNHTYLAGREPPGEVLAFEANEGWVLFAPVATEEERFWVGDTMGLDEIAALTGVEEVRDRTELPAWLEAREWVPTAVVGCDDILTHPGSYSLEHAPVLDEELTKRTGLALVDARRIKGPEELALMRAAAAATVAGHLSLAESARPGDTERLLAARLEAEFVRAGGLRPAYSTLVSSGPHGAVLHAALTNREIQPGDLVVVDAGAEVGGYMCDVTRSWPGGTKFTDFQRDIYEVVLEAQKNAVGKMRPGKEYRDIHLEACVDMARGLVGLDILRGDPESLVARDAHALFFPHGIGHMIGLCTHDVGGYAPGRERSPRFGLSFLRADLTLVPGNVLTIEPGIYFIPALLTNPERREQHRDAVNWELVDSLLEFGGIRIEDDVHVTEGEPEVLTAAMPKERREIEALRLARDS